MRAATSPSLGSPLLEGGDVVGALCVGWKHKHAAAAGQQRFLEIIAARAALGISTRRLADQRDAERLAAETLAAELADANAQLLARQGVLELLQELTTLSTSSLSLPEIGAKVLELMRERLVLRAAALYAMDDEAGALRALALIGFPDEITGARPFPSTTNPRRDASSFGICRRSRTSQILPRARAACGCATRSAPTERAGSSCP